jgi:hypothetical protein
MKCTNDLCFFEATTAGQFPTAIFPFLGCFPSRIGRKLPRQDRVGAGDATEAH